MYVLKVIGGPKVVFELPGHPPITHDGHLTLAHITVTSAELRQLVDALTLQGCRVSADLLPAGKPSVEEPQDV